MDDPTNVRLSPELEGGSLLVEAPWRVDLGGDVLIHREDGAERVPVPAADAYQLELEDFAAAVAGEREPLLGRPEAVGQARELGALQAAVDRKGEAKP